MNILSIVLAALGLGFLVLIHELGHLWVARRRGMKVEAFSIGFGRPIVQWQWQGIQWQVGWLPFGGYVRIAGMEVGKAAKQGVDLYGIQGGFFSKSPWSRIQVALAGPVANLLLALLLFTGVWALGGRMRPFGEVTHRIGWVDPQSELFRSGLRPGDWVDRCNGSAFQPARDWLCAATSGDRRVELSGYRIDEASGRWEPFAFATNPYWKDPATEMRRRTLGIESAAGYLIYPGGSQTGAAAPAGLQKGDRLLWIDGVLLYSARELSVMLNDNRVLVTVERNGQRQLFRVPRIRVADLWLSKTQRDQLSDWRHASSLKSPLNEVWMIPYAVDSQGVVQDRYHLIDHEEEQHAFVPPAVAVEAFLQAGDKIVAIQGVPVTQGPDLLAQLQQRRIQLIVERRAEVGEVTLRQTEDQFFPVNMGQDIGRIAASIGSGQLVGTSGTLYLIGPIEPVRLSQIIEAAPQSQLAQEWVQRSRQIQKEGDPARRLQQMELLKGLGQRYMLGISLHDVTVRANPPPHELFLQTLRETGEVLWGAVHGGIPAKGFSGPLGIVEVLHYGWLSGLQEGLYWLAVISVNLALLNLLPIPVLDGGTVCMALWEWITRRRIRPRTMEQLVIPFVVLLIVFFLFVTYNDLSRLLSG
jgi:regulator of sigma E protease